MSKIEIKNIYKIFGNYPDQILPMVKEGANKELVMEETGHTVGLDNVSISIKRVKFLFVWVYLVQENQL